MEKIDNTLSYIPSTDIPLTFIEEKIINLKILKEYNMRAHNYILALMSNDLQHHLKHFISVASMIQHLKDLFGENSRTARYEISKKQFRAWIVKGFGSPLQKN